MASKTYKKLSEILASTYVMMLKKQNFHWNVKGANFYALHELFGKQYEELFEAIDEIAERIRSLGFHTMGSFEEYLKNSFISEEKSAALSAKEMLEKLILDENKMVEELNEAVKIFQSEGDEASADLVIGRIQTHQKNKWMLESSL